MSSLNINYNDSVISYAVLPLKGTFYPVAIFIEKVFLLTEFLNTSDADITVRYSHLS